MKPLLASTIPRWTRSLSSSSSSSLSRTPSRPRTPSLQTDPLVQSMLRVDHAGEHGAQLIYRGQLVALRTRQSLHQTLSSLPFPPPFASFLLSVLPDLSVPDEDVKVIEKMREQEEGHLQAIVDMMPEKRVRPTLLMPLWSAGGYALGLASGLCGTKVAMAATVAVEEVITQHYNDQLRELAERKERRCEEKRRSSTCNNGTEPSDASPERSVEEEEEEELRAMLRRHRDDEDHHRAIGMDNGAEAAAFYTPLTQLIKAGCRASIAIASRI